MGCGQLIYTKGGKLIDIEGNPESPIQLQLARVHMMVGSKDKAVELLKPLVEVPNNLSKAWLRVDPTFDPLRSNPGFQALVAGTT